MSIPLLTPRDAWPAKKVVTEPKGSAKSARAEPRQDRDPVFGCLAVHGNVVTMLRWLEAQKLSDASSESLVSLGR